MRVLQIFANQKFINIEVYGSSPKFPYPFMNQYKVLWASLVAQTEKNLPAIQETQVQSLGWEDPLEKGMATYPTVLARRIPRTEDPGRLGLLATPVHGVAKNWT